MKKYPMLLLKEIIENTKEVHQFAFEKSVAQVF